MKIVEGDGCWLLVTSDDFELTRRTDRKELEEHLARLSAVPSEEERVALQSEAVGAVKRATRSRDEPWQPGCGFITKGRTRLQSTWGWRSMNRGKQKT